MARAFTVWDVARICHTANRAYCQTLGDYSQPAWEDAPVWQVNSALSGVLAIFEGRITDPRQSHESWRAEKEADGWTWGPVKDPATKQHPCILPYDSLPVEQKAKDVLFFAIARVFM